MNSFPLEPQEALDLFNRYLRVTGVAHTGPEAAGDPALLGKRLGLLNGGAWISLWSSFFGRVYLPGVHLINAGSEAVQINFMQAHRDGQSVPPQKNIDVFTRTAIDLVELAQVDAVLITCSTMNRAYPQVKAALEPYRVPVVQIDRPMMDAAARRAAERGGRVLVVATHGPTVASTQALLREAAADHGWEIEAAGLTEEQAWQRLAAGDVQGHNRLLAEAIRRSLQAEPAACVVLAQLSMTVFLLSHPDPEAEFETPVYTSGQLGFEHMRGLLASMPPRPGGPAPE